MPIGGGQLVASIIELDGNGYPALRAPVPPVPVVTPLEEARRDDLVREAAREFEDLSTQDVQDRLRGITSRDLTPAEVASFAEDVREQVLTDLMDILDQAHKGPLRRRRTVRVSAPRGYRAKALNGLTDDERAGLRDRLTARGWSPMELDAAGLKIVPATIVRRNHLHGDQGVTP